MVNLDQINVVTKIKWNNVKKKKKKKKKVATATKLFN